MIVQLTLSLGPIANGAVKRSYVVVLEILTRSYGDFWSTEREQVLAMCI